jgi:hypothetical protein
MIQDSFNSTACFQEQDVACGGHAFLNQTDSECSSPKCSSLMNAYLIVKLSVPV